MAHTLAPLKLTPGCVQSKQSDSTHDNRLSGLSITWITGLK